MGEMAGPATMTSRAQRDEVAGVYKCERGNRDEGNVDGEQRLKGETKAGPITMTSRARMKEMERG